jgi:hypothetical protein
MREQASEQSFTAPAHQQLIAGLGLAAGVCALWSSVLIWSLMPLLSVLIFVLGLVLIGQNLLGLRNLRRPLLRIAPQAIEHLRLPMLHGSPRRIQRSDVTGIASRSKSKVVLETTAGPQRIDLVWLSKEQRDAARSAIERWAGRPAEGG